MPNFLLGAVLCRELHVATTYSRKPESKSPMVAVDLRLTPNYLTYSPSPVNFNASHFPLSTSSTLASVQNLRGGDSKGTNKGFTCPDCGKALSHKYTLDRHRTTVCGKPRNTEGKWKCSGCERTYESQGSLSRHNKFECGVKPQFYCFLCQRKFTQKCSLSRHLKKKHEEALSAAYQSMPLSK